MKVGIEQAKEAAPCVWEIEPTGKMRVPGRIYATRRMLRTTFQGNAPEQVVNVAQLPGIVGASMAMPDIHWGYGFPIGGVAAFDAAEGVVSPGGVGYDINCGVRLMATRLGRKDVQAVMGRIVDEMFERVPSGVGAAGSVKAGRGDLAAVARRGAKWAVEKGFGSENDLEYIEENGAMRDAAPETVSERAWQRAAVQLGTLGSGNHFIEIGYVEEVYDSDAAGVLGLAPETVTVTVHCGSRGFGHQICEDALGVMDRAAGKYGIDLPERQLSCAPLRSDEGRRYLGAMRCAVNYAFANRQIIAHRASEALQSALGASAAEIGLRTVYEVAHNIAKMETHTIDGRERELCVHRKGATRAFAGDRAGVPSKYRGIGQPVLIPGDMGRYSYVLTGTESAMRQTFGSACHGAGRRLSRRRSAKESRGRNIARELSERGITVRCESRRTLAEEVSEAYKDVSDVVEVCETAGLSHSVARIRPLGCVKG